MPSIGHRTQKLGRRHPGWRVEVSRIGHALRRAEDLPSDVAAAIEAEAGG